MSFPASDMLILQIIEHPWVHPRKNGVTHSMAGSITPSRKGKKDQPPLISNIQGIYTVIP
jgi:hypothetical protein